MELKRDWEMQGLKKKNPLLISQDLWSLEQDTGLLLFQHYLIMNIVVGQLQRLTAFWWWDDPTARPSSLCLYPKLIRGQKPHVLVFLCCLFWCSLLRRVVAMPLHAFTISPCVFALGTEQPLLVKVATYTWGWIVRDPQSIFSELCHRQAAWPWQIT